MIFWKNAEYGLPECNNQHNLVFESDLVLTYDIYDEITIQRYCKTFKSTPNGLKLVKEGWSIESNVLHWANINMPE